MSADLLYAVVTFVRDPQNKLAALNPTSMQTRYRALREASLSIGTMTIDGRIVGAVVFFREEENAGASNRISVVARYGDTPGGV